MGILTQLYRHSLTLLTDLYQLTMAYGYWKSEARETEAAFHLIFRTNPFKGGFSLACGLDYVIDFVNNVRFDKSDLAYLSTLKGHDGRPLFERDFLDHLRGLRITCDIDAVPEGTVVFPYEPVVRVQGPILEAQLLETPLLNLVNFQSLIATKAARVCMATQGEPVLEFGLRRAQGIDGALAASRAAYIGGCSATSNVLAGKLFDIPVAGTHAHSWVMCFDDEEESFRTYAKALPNNCVFLVDTYDSLEGVRKAVSVGQWLRAQGQELLGIRLDSGDLAQLSIDARKILDEGGFPNATIVASNELDEQAIAVLKEKGATIGLWGVGTKLATGYDQPAMGGVYKLAAVRRPGGVWQPRIKLSEEPAKISNPGLQQVRRFQHEGRFLGDVIYDLVTGFGWPEGAGNLRDAAASTDLLVPVVRQGRLVYNLPPITEARRRASEQLTGLPPAVRRLDKPEVYPVRLAPGLARLKHDLVEQARARSEKKFAD